MITQNRQNKLLKFGKDAMDLQKTVKKVDLKLYVDNVLHVVHSAGNGRTKTMKIHSSFTENL